MACPTARKGKEHMASHRSMWSGNIVIRKLTFPVSLVTATQADPEDEALVRLCSCCHQRFTQSTECPAGKSPETAAAIKRGDRNLTPVVYGVEVGEDEYAVVDTRDLEAIRDELEDEFGNALTVDQTVPKDELMRFFGHYSVATYLVRPQSVKKKRNPNVDAFALLASGLARSKQALVTTWYSRGREKLVSVYPVNYEGESLMLMRVLPWPSMVREPDEACLEHNDASVSAAETEMMAKLLTAMSSEWNPDDWVESAVARRRELIDQAVAGELPERPKEEAPAEEPAAKSVPDLMAVLEASMAEMKADGSDHPLDDDLESIKPIKRGRKKAAA